MVTLNLIHKISFNFNSKSEASKIIYFSVVKILFEKLNFKLFILAKVNHFAITNTNHAISSKTEFI